MGFTIDIDAGWDLHRWSVHRRNGDQTGESGHHPPYDITLSWLTAMREGAFKFDFPNLSDFLEQVDIVRWSNTTATNILRERRGRVACNPALEP